MIQERYALYWDFIEAKCGHRVPALSIYQEDLNWQNFSYDGLHQRVGELAAKWASAGVGVGSSITLVAPIGFEFLIGLLTGLRLGATIAWVSPDGPTYIRHRLERLESEFIAANPRYARGLEGTKLDFDRSASNELRPAPPLAHYEPDAIALRLLSSFAPLRDTPVDITAADLYHRTLNDLLIVLELNGADQVSIPGLDPVQYQPWAILTTLLAGGTFVHVTRETLESTPQAWDAFRPTVLGLDDQTRKLMQRHLPLSNLHSGSGFETSPNHWTGRAGKIFSKAFKMPDHGASTYWSMPHLAAPSSSAPAPIGSHRFRSRQRRE